MAVHSTHPDHAHHEAPPSGRQPGEELHDLQSLLDHLQKAPDRSGGKVSLGQVLEAVGHRSFGPLLLVPGLLLLTPVSGVPGMATVMGLIAALVAGQLLLGRHEFWLPQWLLKRGIGRDKFCSALRKVRPVARFVDRLVKPRFTVMVRKPAVHIVAALCLCVGLLMPALEFVPFADTAPGVALAALGLGLIAHDGLLVSIAGALCVASFGLALYAVVGG